MKSGNAPKRPIRRAAARGAGPGRTPRARPPSAVDLQTELDAARQQIREATEREAAIAIDNVRLVNQTTEALARQTATAEVLKAMSQSGFQLQRVFDTIVEYAQTLCAADVAYLYRVEGPLAHRMVAMHGAKPNTTELFPFFTYTVRSATIGRALIVKKTVHIPDIEKDPEYDMRFGTQRTQLAVPLLQGGEPIGVLGMWRNDVRAFDPGQIELVQTFAEQAVIAIENVRLFNETKAALEQQTATSEVLKIISRATSDLQPVFDTIVDSVVRLCHADYATFWRPHAEGFRMIADNSRDADFAAMLRTRTVLPSRGSITGRAALERRVVHLPDVFADAELEYRATPTPGSARSALGVPIVRGDEVIGIISIGRNEIQPFSENEIDLVRTFADQAAIAIENVRLYSETTEALERQTATAELLATMSQSASDLKPVFEMVLDKSLALCRAEYGWIRQFDRDGNSHNVALRHPDGHPPAQRSTPTVEYTRQRSVMARVYSEKRTVHIADVQSDPTVVDSRGMLQVGARTGLGVPLLRGDEVLGVIILVRIEVRPFADREIELVEMFADQAVIAIENTRLFKEIQEKSAQLEIANADLAATSKHKSEFLANMSHELRTPLNAIIGFSDVLEQRMFGQLNDHQSEYVRDISGSGRHLLTLVNEILDLAKVEAGRMELEPTEFVLDETIRGAIAFVRERAAQHRIELTTDVPPDIGTVVADERKVRQVLLNLLSNAVKFTPDGGKVGVVSRRDGSEVEVSVRDTGIGIAPEDLPKVFEEFQQVGGPSERAYEGTGLGLTLAKRFIELHGGRIWVDSEVGHGTTFTFRVPAMAVVAG